MFRAFRHGVVHIFAETAAIARDNYKSENKNMQAAPLRRSMHFTRCFDISFRASRCVAVHNLSETIANARENAFTTNLTNMGVDRAKGY